MFNEVALYPDIRIAKVLLQQRRYVPTSLNHRVQQIHAGRHVGIGLSGPEHLQFISTTRILVVIVLIDVIVVILVIVHSQSAHSPLSSRIQLPFLLQSPKI